MYVKGMILTIRDGPLPFDDKYMTYYMMAIAMFDWSFTDCEIFAKQENRQNFGL